MSAADPATIITEIEKEGFENVYFEHISDPRRIVYALAIGDFEDPEKPSPNATFFWFLNGKLSLVPLIHTKTLARASRNIFTVFPETITYFAQRTTRKEILIRKPVIELSPTPRISLLISGVGRGPVLHQYTTENWNEMCGGVCGSVCEDHPKKELKSDSDILARYLLDRGLAKLVFLSPNCEQAVLITSQFIDLEVEEGAVLLFVVKDGKVLRLALTSSVFPSQGKGDRKKEGKQEDKQEKPQFFTWTRSKDGSIARISRPIPVAGTEDYQVDVLRSNTTQTLFLSPCQY